MKKRLISIALAAIMCISLLIIPAAADKTLGAYTTSALNLRKSAGTSASILMTMPKGAEVIVVSTSNGWSKVMYKNTIGYASKDYLKSDSSVSGNFGTGTITGDEVRMRTGAGTGYSIIGAYNKGTKMTVTGAKGNWYAVKYNGKNGYVSGDYMTLSVTPKSGSTGSSSSSSTTKYTGTITGSDVRMRTGAGTSYSIVGTYAKGTKMTITGSKSGWYKVSYNGKTGYVSGDYMRLVPTTTYSSTKNGTVKDNGSNLRMGPSTSFGVVKTVNSGSKATITGMYGSWYEIKVNGEYGYMYKTGISLGTSNSVPAPKQTMDAAGYVNGDSVRLRRGPSTEYATLGYYDRGTKVTITGKTGGWYAVTINGTKGYMSADYIKLKSDKTDGGSGTELGRQIVATAKQYLGVPYVYGGASPKGFDCSGLVYYVYGQYGYKLQRGAGSQYRTDGTPVDKSDLQPGDLVFFSDNVDPIGHVGMYIGNGQFIHASTGKGQVIITDLDSYYYAEHYTGARRII